MVGGRLYSMMPSQVRSAPQVLVDPTPGAMEMTLSKEGNHTGLEYDRVELLAAAPLARGCKDLETAWRCWLLYNTTAASLTPSDCFVFG